MGDERGVKLSVDDDMVLCALVSVVARDYNVRSKVYEEYLQVGGIMTEDEFLQKLTLWMQEYDELF